jgi:hypothetical protein
MVPSGSLLPERDARMRATGPGGRPPRRRQRSQSLRYISTASRDVADRLQPADGAPAHMASDRLSGSCLGVTL